LLLGFGYGLEISQHSFGQVFVGGGFVLLHDEVIAGEAVFEGVQGGTLFAGGCPWTSRTERVLVIDEIA
jgi:hypothetical protein